jgi:long-chain fatty acid transport protein
MKILTFVFLISIGISVSVFAQSNERVYEELDFRFVTPGARAVGMGKTFVGLADDATAAYTNPAGLSNLLEQEFSFELTTTDIDHHRFIPSEDARTQAFGDRVYAPSFFSYALPKKNFTFSIFRNVVQDYKEDFSWSSRFIPSINHIESGYSGRLNVDASNYGVGISYLIHPKLSIGGSVVFSEIKADISGNTSLARPFNTTLTNDRDTAFGAIFGVLVKATQKLSIGAVYNSGSTFNLTEQVSGRFGTGRNFVELTGDYPIDYVIPDRYSAGAAYRLNDHFTTVSDVSRILYSQQITNNFLILDSRGVTTRDNYEIDDVFEFHSGIEYRLYHKGNVIAFRGGFFTDPDHRLHFRPSQGLDPLTVSVMVFRFNSVKPRTDSGGTFGAGMALSNRFQVDAAFSFTRDAKDIVLSFVWKL